MANLLGANIGTNYKGFLNLDSTINTPLDATLRAVTDGMGNVSPLQLSTTKVAIGTILYFNGITSSFPSIKRNGAAIDFRVADDSGYCDVNTKDINLAFIGRLIPDSPYLRIKSIGAQDMINITNNFVGINQTLLIASSIFAITSTTQGFLPPRMTTTQKNAIASPATGLVVFDTTLNKLAVFTTVWETVTSV